MDSYASAILSIIAIIIGGGVAIAQVRAKSKADQLETRNDLDKKEAERRLTEAKAEAQREADQGTVTTGLTVALNKFIDKIEGLTAAQVKTNSLNEENLKLEQSRFAQHTSEMNDLLSQGKLHVAAIADVNATIMSAVQQGSVRGDSTTRTLVQAIEGSSDKVIEELKPIKADLEKMVIRQILFFKPIRAR